MAINALNPLADEVDYRARIVRPAKSKSIFRLIPGEVPATEIRITSRKFLLLMASIVSVNILVVAGLNILMTQDAFKLQKLKHERNVALDQTDAVSALVNFKNSPEQLVLAATKLGMIPVSQIKYIDLAVAP